MRSRRTWAAVATAVLLLSGLAGCGGSDADPASGGPKGESTSEAPAGQS